MLLAGSSSIVIKWFGAGISNYIFANPQSIPRPADSQLRELIARFRRAGAPCEIDTLVRAPREQVFHDFTIAKVSPVAFLLLRLNVLHHVIQYALQLLSGDNHGRPDFINHCTRRSA